MVNTRAPVQGLGSVWWRSVCVVVVFSFAVGQILDSLLVQLGRGTCGGQQRSNNRNEQRSLLFLSLSSSLSIRRIGLSRSRLCGIASAL